MLRLCVRVVSSSRGGLGKTLFVRRLTDQLSNLVNNDMVLASCSSTSLHVTVPLHGNSTDSSVLVDSLLPHAVEGNIPLSRVFHLDVSPSVRQKKSMSKLVLCAQILFPSVMSKITFLNSIWMDSMYIYTFRVNP